VNLRLTSYPKEDLDSMSSTSLEVLGNVGAKFPDKNALDALKVAGADVDYKNVIAQFPENVVKEAGTFPLTMSQLR